MTINYMAFMKHAKSITKTVPANRAALQGVWHDDDYLVVCNTHYLFKACTDNAPKNVLINPKTGEEITDAPSYPNMQNIIPKPSQHYIDISKPEKLLNQLKAMLQVGIASDIKKADVKVFINSIHIRLDNDALDVEFAIPHYGLVNANLYLGLEYLIASMYMFVDMGTRIVYLHVYEEDKPVLLTNADNTLQAVIMPIRRNYNDN